MVKLTVAGQMAHALGRPAGWGYRVQFPPGRDPAAFIVTGLPGDPDVEVTAEDGGHVSCHYTGRSPVEAASVIARLLASGHPQDRAIACDTLVGTWGGIAVEWHYLPPEGQPADADQIIAALLAHLAVLAGWRPVGGKLLSRTKLAGQEGVSPESASVVLRMLAAEGLVELVQGRGTFVLPRRLYEVTVAVPRGDAPVREDGLEAVNLTALLAAAAAREPAVKGAPGAESGIDQVRADAGRGG